MEVDATWDEAELKSEYFTALGQEWDKWRGQQGPKEPFDFRFHVWLADYFDLCAGAVRILSAGVAVARSGNDADCSCLGC